MRYAEAKGVPFFAQTNTTCMFDTFNYNTAAHRDTADDGRCMSNLIFMEEHESKCEREQCTQHWRFFCPELKRFISIRHGTMIVWNSEVLLHGTAIHSQRPEGACKSMRWAIVSQVKRLHHKKLY
jgi:hypothetical protein